MNRPAAALALLLSLATASIAQGAFSVLQISANSGDEKSNMRRASPTRFGKILFVDAADTVWLYTGSGSPVSVQVLPNAGETVADNVFMLGSGASGTDVIGGWRRGAGYGVVSVNGGTPQTVNLNPESVSIRDGCVFMVLQTPASGQHVFKINPADGSTQQLSSGTVARGALRVASSGCKAAWTWTPTDADPQQLQYWNGSTTTIDPDMGLMSFHADKIVFTKTVSGIQQVFVVDTAVSTTPVQISNETDATKYLSSPQTDGRQVAWYRSNLNGTSPSLMLNGDVAFPAGSLTRIDNVEYAFQLDRGQLLWKRPGGTFAYDDGMQTYELDPSPAAAIENPWLNDGYIAFFGVSPAGGADKEVFRMTVTAPNDAQPAAPLAVLATAGSGQVTIRWNRVLGATSYNLYLAEEPGVTKDNYASLAGGRRITGVSSPHVLSLPVNRTYYAAITTVEGATEGPSSRVASATLIGTLNWQSVGGLGATTFYSVAADASNASYVYAGAGGSVYRSVDGGVNWSQVLANATTGASRTAALAVSGSRILANMMSQADIWQSLNNGTAWTRILEVSGFGELNGSLAVDPSNTSVIYAADFVLPGKTSSDSLVIKSTNGGSAWTHTPEGPESGDEIHAYAMAIDPNSPSTIYAGGSGTPNIVKSTNGAASWTRVPISGNTGGVYSLAVDPRNSSTVYATTRDQGVFRSTDGGANWAARNDGLSGVGTIGTGFNSLIVDPRNSNWLHLGAGNGYWYSVDGGETWTAANGGLSTAYIYGLALTPAYRLIAATHLGLFLLNVAPAPAVSGVSPAIGNTTGGTAVTITGSAFQSGATVTFGGSAATNVVVVSATTITATTPAHAVGAVDVVVSNPDSQTGTLAGGFTYTSVPDIPTGFSATAQSTSSVLVSWNVAPGATSYRVWRRAPGGEFVDIGSTGTTSLSGGTVSANTAYVYYVVAENGSGPSGNSARDVATTIAWSNDALTPGIVVQAAHLSDTRAAINYVRALANLGPATFTDSASPGVLVKSVHVTEMRSFLGEALGALGVASGAYTNSASAGTVIRAVDFQEIRNRLE